MRDQCSSFRLDDGHSPYFSNHSTVNPSSDFVSDDIEEGSLSERPDFSTRKDSFSWRNPFALSIKQMPKLLLTVETEPSMCASSFSPKNVLLSL